MSVCSSSWRRTSCRSASARPCAVPRSTSQLAHVVSSAYIKSPEADKHNGYSAGSYKDLTRVAKLNETMWSELFLCNAEPLAQEIDEVIKHLDEYRKAIRAGDREELTILLRDGRERKERLG